ncbi:sialate:O-sulfotransferase 2-like isoform X2 [Pantherophis guttatus]|uniref:Sialate:O-sulfotransferase 2-like isoform X2 n=1 Tax=Pantherophis guttatus TaxID=94885 RepID=A0A6P9CZC3_PANGU|nr:sialate:O-sulfotransferase 2 isoform X2 [Pantherophis guttatus]XP_060537719.1 sialate:O-sulfotransferase 2-like isoform X2 [Pantherophis guttatus]
MAKLLLKFQRYFWRKPIRFFTLIVLYLTAGSLVFLHAGFSGETRVPGAAPRPSNGAAEGTEAQLGALPLGREFRAMPESLVLARRYGTWFKNPPKDAAGRSRAKYIGCYVDNTHQRALRGVSFFDYKKMTLFRCQDNCAERGYLYAGLEFGAECYCGHKILAVNVSDIECNMECKGEKSSFCGGPNRLSIYRLELAQESTRRYGSAIFRGCFRRPENLSSALLASRPMRNMSVDRCVDLCTGKEYPLAALAGTFCHCGFPTTLFSLHEREGEHLCAQRCNGEEFESCGTSDYFIVYQTQVQDNRCMDRRFLTARAKQLVALASFPGAGNTWARHLIELATGFYTGSYYFDGSLYNKGFKGERDHWRSGRTICIKTHESGQKEIEAFDSAILLVRNPFKALMAEFNRKYGGHIGFASHAHWKGKEWPEFVKNYAPWWVTHTLDWLKFGKKVLVVHFEDLKQDLFVQLKRMVSLLDIAVHEDRLLCVEGQKDGNFKRSGLRKLEYDPYTPEMKKMINGYIKTVDMALKLRNLTGVPKDYYPR